jgi:hypothetical protein
MVSRTVYQEVEVEVDLEDFDTDDLIEELESRGRSASESDYDVTELLTAIWHKRRLGQEYEQELDNLIYQALGKIA